MNEKINKLMDKLNKTTDPDKIKDIKKQIEFLKQSKNVLK